MTRAEELKARLVPAISGLLEKEVEFCAAANSSIYKTVFATLGVTSGIELTGDNSGNFTSINNAVAAATNNSQTRFVIYIKQGVYFEYVMVDSTKTNLMFIGDGVEKTWIRGNRNTIDGWETFNSATISEFLNLNF
ncbi:pectinesterase-like [Rhodamnia argentea]|uniref:Pectinesterase-like n=1 Tax=Rhodamnia argentea TaxID=178133 RepID=A0A8B8Q7Y3_9MYRT|nr:pectinesterase-like [Rhodamnia argentea]